MFYDAHFMGNDFLKTICEKENYFYKGICDVFYVFPIHVILGEIFCQLMISSRLRF